MSSWNKFDDIDDIPKGKSNKFMGVLYAVEYGDRVKIGCTTNLKYRMSALRSQAENYANANIGGIVCSIEHTNYQDNERILHKYFSTNRCGNSELFDITLDFFIENVPDLNFLDDTEKHQAECDAFEKMMEEFVLGKTPLDAVHYPTSKPSAFELTREECLDVAQMIVECPDDNLPVLLNVLSKAGFCLD